jgi:hypothetical protein
MDDQETQRPQARGVKSDRFMGLGLWCLTPLYTISQLYRTGVLRDNHRPAASH